MIDEYDAVVNDDADQDHDAEHRHERDLGAGQRQTPENADDGEHDRGDDRHGIEQRLEQRGHHKEYQRDREQYVGLHRLRGVVDPDLDQSDDRDKAKIIISTNRGEKETVELEETLAHSGIFTGSVTAVVFNVQPTTTTAGVNITPSVQVRAVDSSGNTVTSFNGQILVEIASNPAGGTLSGNTTRVANSGIAWSDDRGGPYLPTPLVYGGYLYTCGNNGVLTCYDARTGKQVYRKRAARGETASFTASPVAADNRIFLTAESGNVLVVKAGPDYELLAENSLGENCLSTPAIAGGMFIARTHKHLVAIGNDRP